MDDAGLWDLYGSDADLARARADAMSRRARGLQGAGLVLRTLTGDRDPTGGLLTQEGQKLDAQLAGAAQHAAQQDVQRQHWANDAAWRAAMLGVNQQKADQAGRALDLKANERGATSDAFGNPILYQKHGGGGPLVAPAGGGAAGPLVGGSGSAGGGAGGGPSSAFNQPAIDQLAELFHNTGNLPQVGRGKSAPAIIARIVNRAAELHPEANLAENKAGFHASQASLQKLQTQADAVNAFERTAMQNLDQFLEASKNVVDTGSPLFNLPARKFAQQVAGNPELTKFNVARQVAVQEIGKVLSGAMGNAAISDSARHEVEGLLSPDASLAQIHAAADILRRDMNNRRAAYAAEIGAVRSRTGRAGAAAPAEAGHGAAPAAAPALSPQDQAAIQWARANPKDPRAAKILALHPGAP